MIHVTFILSFVCLFIILITNQRNSSLLNKFFLSAPKEMYREKNGEYTSWLSVVKD